MWFLSWRSIKFRRFAGKNGYAYRFRDPELIAREFPNFQFFKRGRPQIKNVLHDKHSFIFDFHWNDGTPTAQTVIAVKCQDSQKYQTNYCGWEAESDIRWCVLGPFLDWEKESDDFIPQISNAKDRRVDPPKLKELHGRAAHFYKRMVYTENPSQTAWKDES